MVITAFAPSTTIRPKFAYRPTKRFGLLDDNIYGVEQYTTHHTTFNELIFQFTYIMPGEGPDVSLIGRLRYLLVPAKTECGEFEGGDI